MNQAVGVLIVDEPEGLEPTVRAFLEHEPSLHTVGEADLPLGGPGTEAAVALVFLPDAAPETGIARIAALKRRPGLRVLATFQSLSADRLRSLLAAGADSIVAQGAPPREICAAILALARHPEEPSTAAVPAVQPDPGDGLTPREAEILRFLSAGFSNKEVARRLSLSVRTVETHRLNLRRKTHTGRLKDLVSLARQLGLAPVVEAEQPRRLSGEPAHHARAALETMARH